MVPFCMAIIRMANIHIMTPLTNSKVPNRGMVPKIASTRNFKFSFFATIFRGRNALRDLKVLKALRPDTLVRVDKSIMLVTTTIKSNMFQGFLI